MFNVYIDNEEKRGIVLELGWIIKNDWTNCPYEIYKNLNEDSLNEHWNTE